MTLLFTLCKYKAKLQCLYKIYSTWKPATDILSMLRDSPRQIQFRSLLAHWLNEGYQVKGDMIIWNIWSLKLLHSSAFKNLTNIDWIWIQDDLELINYTTHKIKSN